MAGSVSRGMLVAIDYDRVTLALRDRDGDDYGGKAPHVMRRRRALPAAQGERGIGQREDHPAMDGAVSVQHVGSGLHLHSRITEARFFRRQSPKPLRYPQV